MTEQEIIKRLKENKKMGTPFYFLPEDVRDYLLKHKDEERIFLVFNTSTNEWGLNPNGISCLDESIYALPDFKPYWEVFTILHDGWFTNPDTKKDYPYYDYISFLNESKNHSAFGGWFYEEDMNWSVIPPFQKSTTALVWCSDEQEKVFPAQPTRIRFWRFRK